MTVYRCSVCHASTVSDSSGPAQWLRLSLIRRDLTAPKNQPKLGTLCSTSCLLVSVMTFGYGLPEADVRAWVAGAGVDA